jgi:hypothetical protein
MQLGDSGRKRVAAIRWLDLSQPEFRATEARLTNDEFQEMGLMERREYEEAKSRQVAPSGEAAHG